MKALVVYESLWGNTAAVARAVAEGLGSGARALSTLEATEAELAGADLVVAGSPVLAFRLPTDQVRETLRSTPADAPGPADLSHPPMHAWLAALTPASAAAAAFDTQVRGPFGKAAPAIAKALEGAGYRLIAKPQGFTVAGKYGPLREGELERAKAWGEELRRALP